MTLPVMLRSRHQLLPEYKSPCVFRALRFCIAAIHFFPARVLLKILTRMLCKGCGDALEDTNRYACTMGAKVYLSNTCRPCKRTQAVTIYHLRKQHPKPPTGSACDCCGRIDKLQLDHAHGGTRAWREFSVPSVQHRHWPPWGQQRRRRKGSRLSGRGKSSRKLLGVERKWNRGI